MSKNKTKLFNWSLFKKGYAEGTYPINVIEFVLIITNTLLLFQLSRTTSIVAFFVILLSTGLGMYALGRWNMNPKNRKSIYRQDMLADPFVQMSWGNLRDLKIKAGIDCSDLNLWLVEPYEDAVRRVLGPAKVELTT